MLNYQRVSLPPKPLKPWGQRMPCKPKPSGLSSFLLFKIYSDHFVSYLQNLDQTQMDLGAPRNSTGRSNAEQSCPWHSSMARANAQSLKRCVSVGRCSCRCPLNWAAGASEPHKAARHLGKHLRRWEDRRKSKENAMPANNQQFGIAKSCL